MSYGPINFRQKFELFTEQWQPKTIAEMNDYQFKLVKLQGDFIWHNHKDTDTDETFVVLEGDLRIDFRDGAVHVSTAEIRGSKGRRAQTLRRTGGQVTPD
jgi:mannose-6-phosphate isomerase-like protein (cupin superfamily)